MRLTHRHVEFLTISARAQVTRSLQQQLWQEMVEGGYSNRTNLSSSQCVASRRLASCRRSPGRPRQPAVSLDGKKKLVHKEPVEQKQRAVRQGAAFFGVASDDTFVLPHHTQARLPLEHDIDLS